MLKMKSQHIYLSKSSLKWWRLLFISVIIVGICFRFVNIDKKAYWIDEVFTSLRVSGYHSEDVQPFRTGEEFGVEELQKLQKIDPERGIDNTWEALKTHPEHTPLYFVLARFWRNAFGDSVTAKRSLPIFLSLFAFPCIYWLCRELFGSSLACWLAPALLAISPLHLLYAQEARHYSLWVVTTLLSSAALLRAVRIQTTLSWITYTLTATLALYTSLFSVLVGLSHGIYVILLGRFRLTRLVISHVLAGLATLCLFTPWLWIMVSNYSQLQESVEHKQFKVSLSFLISQWILNLTRNFIDIQFGIADPFKLELSLARPSGYFALPVLILVIYAGYFIVRQASPKVYLFIFSLVTLTGLTFAVLDIVDDGLRSVVPRYLLPCYLGVHIAVAYLLACKLSSRTEKSRKFWSLTVISLIVAGLFSCAVISQGETWWNKYSDYYNPEVAELINEVNRENKTLLISNHVSRIFTLSYLLDPSLRIKASRNAENIKEIDSSFDSILVYTSRQRRLSRKFREQLKEKYQVELKRLYKRKLDYRNRIISVWKFQKYNER
ncbi:MAG: glycosyltransferase family 39 protein [Cyanobacteriota bacterium]|nr:glycosyltransferase family 39 protein [Cyanobacteriota bacterium]